MGIDEVVRIAARAYEQDRYLAALLAPRVVRDDLIVLFAFAGETGRIASTVSEPMLGEIRLQWWRDALASGAAGASGHPVADAFADAIRRHGLPMAVVEGIIDAEDGQVRGDIPEDWQQVASYLAKREGALFGLAWRIIAGQGHGPEPVALAQAGQVYGLTRLLVELAPRVGEDRIPLPQCELQRFGVAAGDVVAGAPAPDGLLELLGEVRERVVADLQHIRHAWRGYPPAVKRSLLPIALVEPYLSAQEKLGNDCLRRVADISPLGRVVRLWTAHRLGWV